MSELNNKSIKIKLIQRIFLEKNMIDLDMMPPDWRFAQNHAKARRPGITQCIVTRSSNNVFCKCCLNPIEKQEVPLCSNSKQLEFLGAGFPIYFIFLKYCIILTLILICSYSFVSIYWAIQNNYEFCSKKRLLAGVQGDQHCTSFLIIFSRIQSTVLDEQWILRLASFLIHIAALIYIRDNIRKTIEYYDERTTSLSDYSLIIKNLPLNQKIQQKIKSFIQQNFADKWLQLSKKYTKQQFKIQKNKVIEITLLPDIKQYFKLTKQKQIIIQQKRQLLKKIQSQKQKQSKQLKNNKKILPEVPSPLLPHLSSEQNLSVSVNEEINQEKIIQNQQFQELQQINKRIQNKNQQISIWRDNHLKLLEQDKQFAQKAIVTLNSQVFKNIILEYAQNNRLDTQSVGQYFGQIDGQIQIEQAHQPNQYIWEDINFTKKDRIIGMIVGWALTVIFITVATIGYYFVLVAKTNNLLRAIQHSKNKDQLRSDSEYQNAVFLVYFLIILIFLFNKFVMAFALHYFTRIQKHQNTSQQEFSFALKYTIGTFFTTALMTLAVEAVTFHNFYSHQYGVIEEESIMFFMNAFFVPFIWIVNPWQIYALAKRKFSKDKPYYTQREANKIMSDTSYIMGKRYAQILKTMWFTFLYSTIIPLGSFITFFGLSIYYWVDKFNLLRKSSLPSSVSGLLAIYSMKLLDFTLILKPIGQLIFDSQMRGQVQKQSIVLTCVAFVYLILPIDRLLQFFHQQKFKQQEKSYQQANGLFLQTYQTLHPLLNHKTLEAISLMQQKVNKPISMTQLSPQNFSKYKKRATSPSLKSLKLNKHRINSDSTKVDEYLPKRQAPSTNQFYCEIEKL